ncbi:sulfurtransferase TusA family protein [Dongia soli]|uniref:Sulfurtransferase TusA family protein n=1 Tax=Dongia soli TaxID=600628 RepID=A0ABU5EBU3_9PROT|nr:sulfurtransferase TusA family protein [Dongia soli]MDY0882933.1 sulfurtransferase TusA family protein [Dongia soli]
MTKIFDARGMKCPLPVLKARRLVRDMEPGEILEIQATDAGAPADFTHFCETTGNRLLETREEGGLFIIRLQVA